MQSVNFGDIMRGLKEHLPLPISLMALAFSGLTYFSERERTAEERAITQSVVWRTTKSADTEGMLSLSQPNEAVAIQGVVFEFPHSLRSEPIWLPPSKLELRGTWIESEMENRLRSCAKKDNTALLEGQLPVVVTTDYSVAGKSRQARDIYTLSYTAVIQGNGAVEFNLESLAIAQMQGRTDLMDLLVSDWVGNQCEAGDQGRAATSANN